MRTFRTTPSATIPEADGLSIRVYRWQVDSRASDSELRKGKAGVIASGPARCEDFYVSTSDAKAREIAENIRKRDAELTRLRNENPKPKLWKKFETLVFGAGRNARFGDLNADGVVDMLIAQNIPRVQADAFDQISCLTAVTFEGKVLWQSGRPDPRNGLLTNDTPFQIHDIDGDGHNEVVTVRNFQLQILDGRIGKVRPSAWMPQMPAADARRSYELENGDSIAFLNLSGDKNRHEILVKDRYTHFWIFNNKLELLWKGDGQTGQAALEPRFRDSRSCRWHHGGQLIWRSKRRAARVRQRQ